MQSCGRALERRMGFSVLTRRTCLYHGGLCDALNFRSASLHGGGGAIGGSAKRTSRVGGLCERLHGMEHAASCGTIGRSGQLRLRGPF